MTGKVIRMDSKKAFGFIRSDLDGSDYFFHKDDLHGFWTDIVSDFKKNELILVEFKPIKTDKGLRAAFVKRTDGIN